MDQSNLWAEGKSSLFLKLKNCDVIDTETGVEEMAEIGIRDGIVETIGEVGDSKADKFVDVRGDFVLPGLVDLHTHVYDRGTSLGVNAAEVALKSGVEVFVDAGSAGAGNFRGFRDHVIVPSKTRILSFVNIGFGGIPFFGIQKDQQVGEIPDLRVADETACKDCIRENRDYIVGIKVRLSEKANGILGVEPLRAAKRCAKELGVPVMTHFGRPPPDVEEIASLLGPGDILTHSFRGDPNSILEGDTVSTPIMSAKKRGVLIDIGHGNGSFSFKTAEAAIRGGFFPDTISTDIHALSLPQPVVNLETTMTKLLGLGMEMGEVAKAVTLTPAKAIGRPQLGAIRVGSTASIVAIKASKRRAKLMDSTGQTKEFGLILEPRLKVRGTEVIRLSA